MEEIRRIATVCVGRAVMFGTLAISCVMIAFAFAPSTAFRSGALLNLVMALVLLIKAMSAERTNHKHTEVWIYLDETTRPVEAHAQFVVATIMRDVYARFARITLGMAVGLFVLSLALKLAGF